MKVVFSPLAEQDLDALYAYIGTDLKNPVAAQNIAEKVLRLASKLARFPEMGASLAPVDTRLSAYRYLVVDNYIIFYRVTDEAVSVARILYGRSDYVRLLTG